MEMVAEVVVEVGAGGEVAEGGDEGDAVKRWLVKSYAASSWRLSISSV